MRAIDRIVIHCSATRAGVDIGAKEIEGWHIERGFTSIGYHKIIRRDGTTEDGRPLDKAGAHAKGFNAYSIGICLVGGVGADGITPEFNFTRNQMQALDLLLIQLIEAYPDAGICGHRDLPGVDKACPCFDVYSWNAAGQSYGFI